MLNNCVIGPGDPRGIRLLNYYRDAELRGAALLLHIAAKEDDPWAQASLTRHVADEARHAWVITRHIAELGGAPDAVSDGYQTRMARVVGVPRTLLDLYAVTLVAEERARARYTAHLESGLADASTAALLRTISADEVWHLEWVRRRLESFTADAGETRVGATLQRYRDADAAVTADLAALERETLGFSCSALPAPPLQPTPS